MDLGNSLQAVEVIIGTLDFVIAVLTVYLTWSAAKTQLRFWEHHMPLLPMHARPDQAPIGTWPHTADADLAHGDHFSSRRLASFIQHLITMIVHWLCDHVEELRRWSTTSIGNTIVRITEFGKRCAIWIRSVRLIHIEQVARYLPGAMK